MGFPRCWQIASALSRALHKHSITIEPSDGTRGDRMYIARHIPCNQTPWSFDFGRSNLEMDFGIIKCL